MSAGQVSDHSGAAALLYGLPSADWLRNALKDKGMKVCIPDRKSRKKTVRYDRRRYKRRNRIEIMFGRLKDWRRVATRWTPHISRLKEAGKPFIRSSNHLQHTSKRWLPGQPGRMQCQIPGQPMVASA